MFILKDIIVKSLCETKSDMMNFVFQSNKITIEEIEKNLEKSYMKYDKTTQSLIIGSANTNQEITETDLRRIILIIPKISKKISVKSQYDEPYNRITNQCSWIAKQFIINKEELIKAIDSGLESKIINLYTQILEDGTKDREQNFKFPHGENIDEVNLDSTIILKTTIYGDISSLYMIDESIINLIYKPNIPLEDYSSFLSEIKNMKHNQMMIINRDGQSFVIMFKNNKYIILDSHQRIINYVTFDNICTYILENNSDGIFYIIYELY